MAPLPLGPIAEQATTAPDVTALTDGTATLTWAQSAAVVQSAAAAMLGQAPDPDQRWGVLGDNAIFTIVAHSAGLLAGVGTVAISRQLTLREITDQIQDAGIVALITGSGGAAVSLEALRAGLHLRHDR